MLDIGFDGVELIGFAAAFLTTIAFIPQVVQIWQTKSVQGLSLTNIYYICYWSFFMVFIWPQYRKFINDYRQFYHCSFGISYNLFYN
jgi:MtN3 and saliva related transmembrane protein